MYMLLALSLTLTGCMGKEGSISLEKQLGLIEKDLASIFSSPKLETPLSLTEAMARGVKFNIA
jgi:hypothetical protein